MLRNVDEHVSLFQEKSVKLNSDNFGDMFGDSQA